SRDLRLAGVVRGPFKNRAEYYFVRELASTREDAEVLIENVLRDAGEKVTTRSTLKTKVTGVLKIFFDDASASLKAEARMFEVEGQPEPLLTVVFREEP